MPSGATVTWDFSINSVPQGKYWFDREKNKLKVSSGVNDPDISVPEDVGSVVFRLEISHDNQRPLKVGFRQAVMGEFSTLIYAGTKEEDGSIICATAGDLNWKWHIDASPNRQGLAPNSPYLQNPTTIPSSAGFPGRVHVYQTADEPSSQPPLIWPNSKTRRHNYLIAQRRKERFLTVAFIEDIDRTGLVSPVPLEARTWRYDLDLKVLWTEDFATAATGTNSLSFHDQIWNNIQSLDGFSRINVSNPNPGDNMVKLRNDAINLAQANGASNSRYSLEYYSNYHEDVNIIIQVTPAKYMPSHRKVVLEDPGPL